MTSPDPDLAPLVETTSRWRRGTWRDFPPNPSCEWTSVITELMWECDTWAEAVGKVEDAAYVFRHVLDHQPRPLPLVPA